MFLKYNISQSNQHVAFDPMLVQAIITDTYSNTIKIILTDYNIDLPVHEFNYEQVVEDIRRAKYDNKFTHDLERELNNG